MITVKPQLTYREGFIVYGHDDSDVCAAASFLAQVIGGVIQKMTRAKFESADGKSELIIYQANHDSDVLMMAFQIGMESLVDSYPGHVEFQYAIPLTLEESHHE